MVRKVKKNRLLLENPFCIYCGGTAKSTSWDHMPNKGMFPKDRVGGLEFPSCNACNQGSTWFEDIASLVCSIRDDFTVAANNHLEKKLDHVGCNHPEVIEEIRPLPYQLREAAAYQDSAGNTLGTFNLQGKVVSSAMLLYGAKLAMALHWEKTKRILKNGEEIGVMYFTNANEKKKNLPLDLFKLLPDSLELKQGAKKSSHPFFYNSGEASDTGATAHWANFGDAIYYKLFVGGKTDFSILPATNRFSPGCLCTKKPEADSQRVGWGIGPVTLFR